MFITQIFHRKIEKQITYTRYISTQYIIKNTIEESSNNKFTTNTQSIHPKKN